MTTSGSYSFSRNRDQIIAAAARRVGAIASGETPDATTVSDFSEALNAMVKSWQTQGVYIWTATEGILFLQLEQSRYTLSVSSTDKAAGSYVETNLSADAVAGATSISVDSITSISNGDNIGVQLDDGTLDWSTVSGSPSGSTVTMAAGLGDSASDGALVLVYTSNIVRPLKIISARRFNLISSIETPMNEFDRVEYMEQPNKANPGSPTSYYYDRRGGANSSGYFYVWPEPDSVEDAIKFTFARPIQDFSAAGNDADLPQEWIKALISNLAFEMADDFDVPPVKYARMEKRAARDLAEAAWGETELTDIDRKSVV